MLRSSRLAQINFSAINKTATTRLTGSPVLLRLLSISSATSFNIYSSRPTNNFISPKSSSLFTVSSRTFRKSLVSPRRHDQDKPEVAMNQQLAQAKSIWRESQAVCFDVDSTLIQDEAIDELANFCGKGEEVQALTAEAMKGGMEFREALALRLDLIRPTQAQLRSFIHTQKQRLTPYVKELIHELHKLDKDVFLVSGGFRSIIEPVASTLNIPTVNIYANRLKFFYEGTYAGFDETQLTSRSGGKAAAVQDIMDKYGYDSVVMIGDGMTDWEACPPADLFIGFGGNAYRQEVKKRAPWYVTDFRDLINELKGAKDF